MSIFDNSPEDSIGQAPPNDQPKPKRKRAKKRHLNVVTDASARFAALRREQPGCDSDQGTGLSEEKKRAIIAMFDEMAERSGKKELKRKIERSTRKLASLWVLIEDELDVIREAVKLPKLGSPDPFGRGGAQ